MTSALLMALCLGTVSSPAQARPFAALPAKKAAKSTQAAQCEVWAVHASKSKPKGSQKRLPGNLSLLGQSLRDDQFAAYQSFHLLEHKSVSLSGTTPGSLRFRAGFDMALNLVKISGARLKVHVRLGRGKGSAKLVDLDYWMGSGGLLMLVGGSYQDGKILFATRCRAAG